MMKNLLSWGTILVVVLLGSKAGAAVVKDVKVPSAAMNKEIPVAVILPDSYREGEMERFPVIYMLHGAGGSWLYYSHKEPAAETRRLVDEYDVIAVAPDGGATSWWLDSPVDPTCRYETFVTEELVPYVDANYRTKAERGKRAIMGASMGGHGACWIGFRHKDAFCAVGNIYGGVDLRPFKNQWQIAKRLGPLEGNEERWLRHSVVGEAAKLKNGDVALCTMVGTSDIFLQVNRNLHEMLTKNGVEHVYVEYRGDSDVTSRHDLPVMIRSMPMMFAFIDGCFRTGLNRFVGPDRKTVSKKAPDRSAAKLE